MNRPARFTVADLRRATKVAEQTGRDVEIAPDGTIRIVRRPERAITAPEPVEEEREFVIW
jgi:hypothetical protein